MDRPLLIVDDRRVLFIGPVDHVPPHAPMVPVFGGGVEHPYGLRIDGETRSVRAAVVGAQVSREVFAHGELLAVMPFDPGLLRRGETLDEDGAVAALQALTRGHDPRAWRALATAVGLSERQDDLPAPIERALEVLRERSDENAPVERIAEIVGLSVSRLQHAFKEHVGTTMRTYRLWKRFVAVAAVMRGGGSLTEAAHHVGFFDSAHLSRAFRRCFGVTPSFVFAPEVAIHVV
ncbi:MAG: AraC family transcriptional regulator [Polyangiaceae bacterium]